MAEENSKQENSSLIEEVNYSDRKPSSSSQEMNSTVSDNFSDTKDDISDRRRSSDSQVSQSGQLVNEDESSTPTSGTDYQSCSNPSTPERATSSERRTSVTSTTDLMTNVKMSANVATKLNQMRVSVENLDVISQISCEDEISDTGATLPHQDSVAAGDSPQVVRKVSLTPSLRQIFPYISCLPFENNIVFCFVLSVWDNIVGPQTVYVWKRKSFPSQKTFDDLLDEKEDIEVGEESVEIDRVGSQLKRMSQGSVTQDNTSNSHDFKKVEKLHSRKLSTSVSLSENHTPVHGEKNHLNRSGNVSTTSRGNRKTSLPKEMKLYSKSLENVSAGKCYADQNLSQKDVQKSESVSGNRSTHRSGDAAEDERPVGHTKRTIDTSLRSASIASVDSASLDTDGQEFGGSWTCGRGRLRMAMVARYVTEHSVAVGQVGMSSEKITTSFLVVPHQGIIIVAARFIVIEDECGVPYCLSMVVPLDEYDYFLPLTQPVTTWLITIAASTRLLITKHGLEGGGMVRSKLVELCDVLVALRSASLDQYPLIPAGRPPDDRRLAEIILTSHLQTLGSTVVVADSPNAANKVVMWIAQFSDPSDLHVSRLCLSYTQWPFHPGLSIQGIVRSANGEVNLSAQKLIQSSRPLTVVDINRGTVKQTGAPDVHARRNNSALHQELLSLWHDLPDVSAPSESLLEPVRGAAPLVKRFLQDYDRLSSCENTVRQNFIRAFLRSLQYSALAVITWTQQEWSVQRRRSGYGSLRRALCSVFDYDDSDLRIILAQAELLQPGFYTY
ncbi:hypothetical protein SK128_004707, partial [Halocaridina rubra]